MRKSCKKIVSVLIAMIILFTVAPITTSALTQNDVVSWMDSKNGTTIYDGGSQCVAAFNSYLRIWGISNPISKYPVNYAYQIFNYNAPDDWQKISGSGNYQVGDVVIWNSSVGGGAGHVGMVYSTSGGTVKIFDQNYVTKNVCGIHNIAQTSAIIGVFRPPLGNNLPDQVDLGTDFYAYIMNTNSWKPLVNDSSHNACFNYDVYENQKIWHFIKKSNGSYKIISLFDNNALDVDLGKSDSGTDVGVWTDSDTANQEWFIYGSSAQYYLKPNCSNCVLDMTGGKYYDGVNAQIFTKNGTDAQLFQIWKIDSQNIPVDVGSDFYAYIINTAAWKSLSNDGNHNACFDDNLGKNNKVWHFIKKPNGSYKILSILDNNALDVDLGKSESETDVGVWTDSDTANQEWFIYGSSAQYYLKPNCSNCVLDMTGGKYYDGVNAQIFTKNGTDAQLFQIWKVDIVGDFSIKSTVDDNIVNLDWTPSNNAEGYKVNIWNTDSIEDTPYCSCVTTNTHFSKELPQGNYRVCVFSYNNSSEKASNIIYVTIKDVISSIDIDSLGFKLSLSSNSYTYDGKAKIPTVTIKNDTATLIKDTDYTVEYSNNINAGTATVTVTGIGNYTGILTKTFIINKAQQTVNATISSNTLDIGDTSEITASGQGTISYISSNTNVATVNNSGIVTGISAGTATITVTATGNNNYNEASKTFTVLVKNSHVLGDVNCDGVISIADATTLQKYLANIVDFNDEQLAVADTNGDGSVSIADATQIQRYLAQLIPSLG